MILLLFLAVVSVGILLLIEYLHRRASRQREKEILKLIVSKGRVTPLEIAAETDQSIKEVKAALDRLCYEGLGKLDITDDGILVYIFEDALSLNIEKNRQKKSDLIL